jgi:hypothetical protein
VLLMVAVGAQSGELNCDAPGPACDRAMADFEAKEDRETAAFGAAGGVLMALVVFVLTARSRRTSHSRSSARR